MRNPFRCFNSSPEVIRLVVMMYLRYPLDGACADANSDRPGDLERRPESPAHALRDNRET